MRKITLWSLLGILLLSSCASQKQTTANKNMEHAFPVFDAEAHRGGRGLMPENTIAAMKNGIDLGVTTLEMDVIITRDKKVIVSHDPYFNADITTTPEGEYLTKAEASKRILFAMDYDSIKKYDVGLKPHPLFPRQQKIAAQKPLLTDLLKQTEAYAKEKGRQPLWYNIETKSRKGGDGILHPAPEEFVDLLVGVIKENGVEHRTVIQSFDIRTLQVVHKKYPDFKTSLLVEGEAGKRSLDEQLKELGFTPFVYSPNFSLVTPEVIKACHEKGIKIVPWTVNNKEEIERLKAMGVDGIITDYPDLF